MRTLHVPQRTPSGDVVAKRLAAVGMASESGRTVPGRDLANGVKYAVGGWSAETRRELIARATEFPVMLAFVWKQTGEYLPDVRIEVRDAQGRELLILEESGPIVLLDLAPGTYRIDVTRDRCEGHTRTLTIGPRTRRQAVFYWDDNTVR